MKKHYVGIKCAQCNTYMYDHGKKDKEIRCECTEIKKINEKSDEITERIKRLKKQKEKAEQDKDKIEKMIKEQIAKNHKTEAQKWENITNQKNHKNL